MTAQKKMGRKEIFHFGLRLVSKGNAYIDKGFSFGKEKQMKLELREKALDSFIVDARHVIADVGNIH